MSRACSVCNHPRRKEIDESLAEGRTIEFVARDEGLQPSSVRRHRVNHLSAALVRAAEAQQAATDAKLLGRVNRLATDLEADLAKTRRRGDLNSSLKVVRELRCSLELLGKVTGELATSARVHGQLMGDNLGRVQIVIAEGTRKELLEP